MIARALILTLLVAGVRAILLVAAPRASPASAPNRNATTDLGRCGLVIVRVSTVLKPPLLIGTVTLRGRPMDLRQQVVALA